MIVADGITFVRTARRVRAELGQRHRYAHVLRVSRLAVQIARAHHLDEARALTAGLLHDLARLYSNSELLAASDARKLTVDAFEHANPIVLHARIGAELAKERYAVDDAAVLSAIAKHTVAGAEMSPLDCAVYLADSLEPARDFPEREQFVRLALADLDGAMLAVLRSSAAYLRKNGLTVAPQTIAALSLFEVRSRVVA